MTEIRCFDCDASDFMKKFFNDNNRTFCLECMNKRNEMNDKRNSIPKSIKIPMEVQEAAITTNWCPGWISVKHRPPPERKPVFLYITYPEGTEFNLRADALERTNIIIGGLEHGGRFIDKDENEIEFVSHWMPLPEGPKE